jgi:hypothetical protein
VGQHVCHHVGALSVSMCPRLKKNQVDQKLDRIELYNKEMDLFIPIFSCTMQP